MRRRTVFSVCLVALLATVLALPLYAGETGKVNINKAGVEELTQLKNIGRVIAERIVERRESEPFRKPEDLMKVKGIGPKVFEEIRDQITL
jgi:competence protein ComEA